MYLYSWPNKIFQNQKSKYSNDDKNNDNYNDYDNDDKNNDNDKMIMMTIIMIMRKW